MGSKSAQNSMQMRNLLSDYVGYILNLCILVLFWFDLQNAPRSELPGKAESARSTAVWAAPAAAAAIAALSRARLSRVGRSRFTKFTRNQAKIYPPERFMGSKSAQNVMLMPNLLSENVVYFLNRCILDIFWVDFGVS